VGGEGWGGVEGEDSLLEEQLEFVISGAAGSSIGFICSFDDDGNNT
jgi:hypothetical protein